MTVLYWIVAGVVAGALMKALLPGPKGADDGGWLGDLTLGLIGALLGGFAFQALLGFSGERAGVTTLVALIGSVALLLIGRALGGGLRRVS